VTLLCHIAFDKKDSDGSKGICSTVAGELTKGSAFVPKHYKENAEFKVWKASLETAAEIPPPVET